MANKRDLKKEINHVLGDIIENVYLWESTNGGKRTKESEAIIEESITTFDDLMARVSQRKVEDNKKHFTDIRNDLETKAQGLIDRINNLD